MPTSLETANRWNLRFEAGKTGEAFAGQAFCRTLAAAITNSSAPAEFFASLDQHSFMTTAAATREVCAVLSRLLYVHTERIAPEFTRRYGAILSEVKLHGDTLRARLAQCGSPLSEEAIAAIHDWDECSTGEPFYTVDIRPVADGATECETKPREEGTPRNEAETGLVLPEPKPDGTNPFLVIGWDLFTAHVAARYLTQARQQRVEELGRKMRTEEWNGALRLHWEDDVDRSSVEKALTARLFNSWTKALREARRLCAEFRIPFDVHDPLLRAAEDKMQDLDDIIHGVASDKEVYGWTELENRLSDLADSTSPTHAQKNMPTEAARPNTAPDPVMSSPPTHTPAWAWPKHPFGKNSGMGCHDATARRPFPEGNLHLATDIRWELTARREPGTVFGVLTHQANTNQENFGVGRRYYLPSAEDVSQVARLSLPNTPDPANPNWLAIKAKLRENGHPLTELATLTPPELLAMLATPATVPAPPAPEAQKSVEGKTTADVTEKKLGIVANPSDGSTQPTSPGELLDYANRVRDSLDDDSDHQRDDVLNLLQVRKAFVNAHQLGLVRQSDCPEAPLNRDGAKRKLDYLIPLLRNQVEQERQHQKNSSTLAPPVEKIAGNSGPRKVGGRPKLSDSKNPADQAKLNVYELVRAVKNANPSFGEKQLLQYFKNDKDFKQRAKDAELVYGEGLFRAALVWLSQNPVAQETRAGNVS